MPTGRTAALFVPLFALPPAQAQDAAEVCDPRVFVPVGTYLLVDHTLRSEMTLVVGGRESRFEALVEQRFLDGYTELEDDHEVAHRLFLEAHADVDGQVRDPVWAGIEATYVLDQGRVELSFQEDRALPSRDVDRILALFDSVGLWVDLPAEMAVGDSRRSRRSCSGTR